MRTDSEDFRNLDSADKWLAKYTYESLDKWPSREIIDDLLERYPNQINRKVYRGINFNDKEHFDKFIEATANGYYESHGISSWGPDNRGVRNFALTQPTYFLNREVMMSHSDAQNRGEEVTGYRGVIISTTLQPGEAIDVDSSGLGHESEYILPPGKYRIEIEQIKRFDHQLADNETTLDKLVLNATTTSDKGLRFVIRNDPSKLSDVAKHHLFGLFFTKKMIWLHPPEEVNHKWYDRRATVILAGKNCTYTRLESNFELFEMAEKGWFMSNDMDKVTKMFKAELKHLAQHVKAHPETIFTKSGIMTAAKMVGDTNFINIFRQHVKFQYDSMQKLVSGNNVDIKMVGKYVEVIKEIIEQVN